MGLQSPNRSCVSDGSQCSRVKYIIPLRTNHKGYGEGEFVCLYYKITFNNTSWGFLVVGSRYITRQYFLHFHYCRRESWGICYRWGSKIQLTRSGRSQITTAKHAVHIYRWVDKCTGVRRAHLSQQINKLYICLVLVESISLKKSKSYLYLALLFS